MNLYLKHRPQTLDEVIGNVDIVSYLRGILPNKEKIPHVFLLHGDTGCGKTTLARIIATEIGCNPVDLKEINVADFRGIDTVREIIKSSRYHSIGGGARVWIFDEFHKSTNDAQNALLKLFEDSPANGYFILCTTEPEKVINTIKGRCISLQVKPLNETEMHKLLRSVSKKEGHKISISVYEQIIQDSMGLPRNALQILDKVLSVPEEQQLEIAKQSAAQQSQSIELCRALLDKSPWKKVREILVGLKDQDAEGIRRHVLGYCQSVLLRQENDRAAFIIEMFRDPLYNIGYPGLVFNCYSVVKG
jgi:DNA polymerase-3 subunit gamma/tau